jgi:hypothetical protein
MLVIRRLLFAYIIRAIRSGGEMGGDMEAKRDAYRIFIGKPEGM